MNKWASVPFLLLYCFFVFFVQYSFLLFNFSSFIYKIYYSCLRCICYRFIGSLGVIGLSPRRRWAFWLTRIRFSDFGRPLIRCSRLNYFYLFISVSFFFSATVYICFLADFLIAVFGLVFLDLNRFGGKSLKTSLIEGRPFGSFLRNLPTSVRSRCEY